MADLKQTFRQLRTTVESGPGGPQKINLLFIGTLAGTAVIGLIALFAYGAYSGSGSGICACEFSDAVFFLYLVGKK